MSRDILKEFSYHMIVGEHASRRGHPIARAGWSAGGAAGDGRMARAISSLERQVFIRRQCINS